MRFAYIDSQGNEVSIPSVDALALRVELGAIGPDTELYDAQADRWGPAHTHEIYHTLARSAEDDGFVAPPPVAPAPPVEPESGPEPESEAELPAEAPAAEGSSEDAATVEPQAVEADAGPAPVFDLSEDLALVGEEFAADKGPDDAPSEGGGDMAFDLAPAEAEPEPPAADSTDLGGGGMDLDLAPEPAGGTDDADGEEGGFDFGDLSGGLELEGPPEPETPELPETPLAAAPDADFAGGMELEPSMDFSGGDAGGDMGGGLELEQPMSEFTPDAPPTWMEQEGTQGGAEDPMQPGAAQSDSTEPSAQEAPAAERKRPESRSRPSPPRRVKQKGLPLGAIMAVVAVGVVGAGGFFGWKALNARSAAADSDVPRLPEVVIPDIPAELLPQMRDMAEAALADMIDALRATSTELDISDAPRQEWLSGRYLANASQYPDVEEFWLGIERFVDQVRDSDQHLFHAAYVARVEGAGLAADTAAMLIERADSGFVAARDGRIEAYNLMDDLINAALDLHQFLIDNEADIVYEPASGGISRDPVLEAVPATDAMGEQMWGLVDGITGALRELGTLDRVTTERLFAVLFDRIRRAGIQ